MVLGYDAEIDADEHIRTWTNGGRAVRDEATTVVRSQADKIANWFLPEGYQFEIKPRL